MNKKLIKKLKIYFNSKEDLELFLSTPIEMLWTYHHAFGTWIRNNILNSNKKVLKFCEKFGVTTDGISNDMIFNFYMELKK